MRRVIAVILCLFLLITTAYASNTVNSVSTTAVVNEDGSCHVTVSATLAIEESAGSFSLPLGSGISSVTLNGAPADLSQSGGVTSLNLSSLTSHPGTVSLSIQYTVDSVLSRDEEDRLIATVPLLPGFPYPVQQMDFTVTMPSEFETVPSFHSGYHGQDIERRMTTSVTGSRITGKVNEALKDSETLYLKLVAGADLFPQTQAIGGTLPFDAAAMGVCILVAMLYWIATMGCLPKLPIRRSLPPEGISAGILSCYLVHKPADLNMMVVGWAQLGYLIIHLDDHGRVMLHKKMDMGNERSAFEQRCFRNLFGRGTQIDATGYRYTMICEKTIQLSSRHAAGFRPGSGNPMLFRLLAAAAAIFAGIALGDSAATTAAWRIILMILGSVFLTWASWHIQEGMYDLHFRDKTWLKLGMLLCGVVLTLGIACGCFGYMAVLVLWSLFAGLAAAYGGHRSENGNRIFTEILGLRRNMRKLSKGELDRILQTNPGYFYELAPYALAMGVDKQFAAQFGRMEQPMCTWLVTSVATSRTASEWILLLRKAADTMNCERKRTFWEKLLNPKNS